ncbi:MAG: N-6 DNA methylase, partial [Acetobacter sp.]|nr:N-6 DNA methylase [Acetobacter sp.]
MITQENLPQLLETLEFSSSSKNSDISPKIYTKTYNNGAQIIVNFQQKKISYPEAIQKGDETTCNFSHNENFVVLECVNRLLEKGYPPENLELEPRWRLGRESKTSGKADIVVRDNTGKIYIIIECKTAGAEFNKEWENMRKDGGQLLSYFCQDKNTQFLCLYTSDYSSDVDKKLTYRNIIISTKDNEDFLREKNLKGYNNAKTVPEIFQVWRDVYEFAAEEKGIFEPEFNAYNAGKAALNFNDLKEITQKDTSGKSGEDGKYHEFAKILRKYNISGKENAFDKLVNLFLCKIYDETHNKDNLHFCYRGVMADSFESLQDRLMILYKDAMKEFLHEDITYVSNEEIGAQFHDFKRNKIKTKALQEQIEEFIRQLKFYSHSDFSFLEVHNKKLFLQNALVLRDVVQLFQNYKLTSNQTTQFLGNLFELFLQKGMKQDEGQFFTPLPICEFIMYALPLKALLQKNPSLKVIDYACGAGHFLNTYANVVAQIEDQQPRKEGAKTTAQSKIYGIEKEYRLSKVAKVSSAMYGQNINITYADALDKNKFTEKDFDLLVANPPYSVKGFLETLSKKMRKSYELFDEGINLETNAIECFFVERANDLLKSHAKAAIILPVSILTKDGIYEKTRQILFRHFDIIAINELGGGTFGATGTNTIILFLSKKPVYASTNESQAYLNLKENIEESLSFENVFLAPFLREYCAFQNYPLEDFKAFLEGVLTDTLNNHEVFKEYRQAFLTSAEYKTLQKSNPYKTAPEEEQNTRKEKEFITFCLEKEKEKLLYFSLIGKQKTLIIKSPTENKAAKNFLGYEWSDRKGSEGLKELNNPYCSPLFERDNLDNSNKIAFLIRNAFLNNTAMNATLEKDPYAPLNNALDISPELAEFAQFVPLNQCLDFKTATFNKVINLSLITTNAAEKSSLFENCQFELVKLGSIIEEKPKSKIQVKEAQENLDGIYPFFTSGEKILKFDQFFSDGQTLFLNTGGKAGVKFYNGKAAYSTDTWAICSKNENDYLTKFLFYLLQNISPIINDFYFKGSSLKHLQKSDFKNISLPKPNLEIQQQIVNACEEVEAQNHALDRAIADQHDTISAILSYTKITDADFHQ